MILRQFIVYIAVGLVSAAIDVGLMQALIFFEINYLIAATFGFFIGFLANFFMHSRITFKENYSHSMFARYIAVVLANYALTLTTIQAFHHWFTMPVLGKIISLPLVAINGFFFSKYWIYKNKDKNNKFYEHTSPR